MTTRATNVLFFVCGVFSDADEFNQVFVVELLHDVKFVLKGVKSGCFFLVFLDGDQSSLFVFTEFDSK